MLCQQKRTWCEGQSLMTLFVTAAMKLMKLLCMPSRCVRKLTLFGLILSCGLVGGRYIFFASKSYYPRWLSSKTMPNSLPWLRGWFGNKEVGSNLTKQLATSTKSPNSPRKCYLNFRLAKPFQQLPCQRGRHETGSVRELHRRTWQKLILMGQSFLVRTSQASASLDIAIWVKIFWLDLKNTLPEPHFFDPK